MASILLGVTGSIAAYKAADLASKLTQGGHGVTVLMTEAAQRLVTANTFMNLTGNRVFTDLWDPETQTAHIAVTDAADLFVLAPATANSIAKLALGLGDDAVSTTLLALGSPLLVCPAMNPRMWANPAVQEHLATIKARGHHVFTPSDGHMACGHVGTGRMREPAEIVEEIERLLSSTPTTTQDRSVVATDVVQADISAALEALGDGLASLDTGAGVFFELMSLETAPGKVALEAERRFRAEALADGRLLASGALGPTRWGHVHKADSLDDALALARRAPLSKGKCSIHVFPWSVVNGGSA